MNYHPHCRDGRPESDDLLVSPHTKEASRWQRPIFCAFTANWSSLGTSPRAAEARTTKLGIWNRDATADFSLADQASIGPDGQLILPKLFRRCTDYLKAVDKGFIGNLGDWLLASSATPSRDENDRVLIRDTTEVHLTRIRE